MKTHRFDALSFLSGFVITAIGLLFLIPQDPGDLIDFFGDVGSWFWPVLLLAIGAAVLVPLATGRNQDNEEDEELEEAG